MKSILILTVMLLSNINAQSKKVRFTIDVFDFNSSMAFTLQYHITNDSLIVTRYNGFKGERTALLLQKKLTEAQEVNIANLIKSPSFKSLKNAYRNALVADGDQKKVVIQSNGKKKTIEIENVYNNEVAKLIDDINCAVDHEFKIRYTEPSPTSL